MKTKSGRFGVAEERRGRVDAVEEGLVEVADDAAHVAGEAERVAADEPDDRGPAHGYEALDHNGEHVLAADEPAVEKRQPRVISITRLVARSMKPVLPVSKDIKSSSVGNCSRSAFRPAALLRVRCRRAGSRANESYRADEQRVKPDGIPLVRIEPQTTQRTGEVIPTDTDSVLEGGMDVRGSEPRGTVRRRSVCSPGAGPVFLLTRIAAISTIRP
jgi:hypothetical protein